MRPFFMHRWEEATYALLRVVTGGLMMQHGAQKLFGLLKAPDAPPGTVPLFSQMGLAGVLEFFGALLVAVGLFTRPVSFVMSGLMAAAYFIGHAPQGFWPILNKGELAALYCFVFLYFAARGGGRYSLDHALFGRRAGAEARRV
jgi:putative oxidoreductase